MTTKTKNSTWFMAMTMIVAIVLGIGYESLQGVPASQVQAANIPDTQSQVSTMRDSLISFVKDKIENVNDTEQENSTIVTNTWSQSSSLPVSEHQKIKKDKSCIPDEADDIINHPYHKALTRWLAQCLVTTQGNNRVYPDNHLTHSAMLLIAEQLWYNVDTQMGSSDVVSRSELLRFIDYLQNTHQVSMIPALSLSTIVTRAEYLNFMQSLSDITTPTQPTTNTTTITTIADTKVHTVAPTTSMTIKEFKELMNSTNNSKFIITAYDAQVTATPEIIASLLKETQSTNETTDNDSDKIDLNSIGINKEMLKEWLNWIVQKI
jgi:hypothetical protein